VGGGDGGDQGGAGLGHLGIGERAVEGMHPTRSAEILVADTVVGVVGEVDPAVLTAFAINERVGWLELDLRALLQVPHGPGQLVEVSRFPSSDVDLSFEVDEGTPAGAILHTLRLAGVEQLVEIALFDVYRGPSVAPGRRSLTFRARFQALDHTLTDAEVAEARDALIAAVSSAHAATLRT
jgi:phenylalanyl-tRNA synthetase beta chain